MISAEQAYHFGFLSALVDDAKSLAETCEAFTAKLMKASPLARSYAKTCINASQNLSLAEGIEFENKMFGLCFATEDQTEGMGAFAEKRKPEFKGR
jgi:enoyl-CoA hydratase/carnithine racemase